MTNDKAVSVLNNLIETCKDGEKGFKEAAEGLKSADIKAKFMEYSRERAQMAAELQAEVRRLGGDPDKSGSMSASLHRGWMDLKAAVSGHDDHAIVSEAERGEDVAKKAYEDALKSADVSGTALPLVQQQAAKVRRVHDEVRDIRDRRTATT
ncbi:MAG: PA2169 family four-helix-bundle protein [Acidobacteria bacterium]|nr:PA2169 family four-helix-bundle protein [Acidobacteriota bacterium]